MDSMRTSCAFKFLAEGVDAPLVLAESYTNDKFAECLSCAHHGSSCEKYTCSDPEGRNCLLQLGVSRFKAKPEAFPL